MKAAAGLLFGIAIALTTATTAIAHGGRTDASGCHNDNINGGRHCHNDGDSDSGAENSTTALPAVSDTDNSVRDLVIVPPTQLGQESRIEFFEHGYMIVPNGAVDRYMAGLSAAITNAAGERNITAAPVYYGITCSDFNTQQEAQFHYLFGSAPSYLRTDLFGNVCTYLTDEPRIDGTVVNSISTTTGQVEIRKTDNDFYYLWIEEATVRGRNVLQITTGSFPDFRSARNHYERYYQGR